MKIVQLYDSYQVKGGVERVLSLLLNAWAGQGQEVTLLVRSGQVSGVYPLRPDVDTDTLGRPLRARRARRWLDYVRDWAALRRHPAIGAADIVIANGPWCGLLAILALKVGYRTGGARLQAPPDGAGERLVATSTAGGRGTHGPVRCGRPALIVCDHNSPPAFGRLTRLACRLLYRKADCIIALTQAQRAHYRSFAHKVRVIPNPVAPAQPAPGLTAAQPMARIPAAQSAPRRSAAQPTRVPQVLAMGRLTRQKGFDLLLEAWAIVVQHAPEAHLTLVGEGEEQAALQRQALHLGIVRSVTFAPFTDDVARVYAAASLLVMSSRHEGLALVALEAQSHGLPIVSFDCEFGPREVITDGVDGVLCEPENVEALAEGMLRLLRDEAQRTAMSAAARESAKRYALPEVLPHWDAVFAALRFGDF